MSLLFNGQTTDGKLSIIVYRALLDAIFTGGYSVNQVIALIFSETGHMITPRTAAKLLNNCYAVLCGDPIVKCQVIITKKGATYERVYRATLRK